MNNRLVSIITPSYNCSSTLAETATSIFDQTYQHWEWLITDDCSDSQTQELLAQLQAQDSRIKVFYNTVNQGAALSRNQSLSHAQGEFIAFLDSDDLWLPDKLERQVMFMGDEIDFSFTAYQLIDNHGHLLAKVVDGQQSGTFSYHDMLRKKATLGCSTVMLRRRAFNDLNMPLLRTGQDYALWLKLLKSGAQAHVLAQPLTLYRIMPNSISRNKFKKATRQWQIYRQIEKLSFLTTVYCFVHYAWRAIFRR